MNELALTGISLLVLVLAGLGSIGLAVQRKMQRPEPASQPTRAKRARKRLTQPEREAERAIILAALLAGVEQAMIARLLRGDRIYNRRKVGIVYRLNEQRIKRQAQLCEQATTQPPLKPMMEAAV